MRGRLGRRPRAGKPTSRGPSSSGCIGAVSTLDPGNALFDSQGFEFDVHSASATGPNRNNPFATLENGGDNGPAGTPPGPRSSDDAWDQWGSLFVGGDALPNLYFSTDDNSCTREDGGRELVFPQTVIGGLLVQRKLFVAPNGFPGGRLLNLVTNPGTAPVTTSVQVGDILSNDNGSDLGSDNNTGVRSTSSGGAPQLTTADLWAVTSDHEIAGTQNHDPALAHVFDGNGGRQRISFVTRTGNESGRFRAPGQSGLPLGQRDDPARPDCRIRLLRDPAGGRRR